MYRTVAVRYHHKNLALVHVGDTFCLLMTPRKAVQRTRPKRFSVTLTEADYERLKLIAEGHRPRFTLQYVVNWSIQKLLERAEDKQLYLELGNPLGSSK